MKRDFTVTLSLILIVGIWTLAVATGHGEYSSDEAPPLWMHLFIWPMVLGMLRACILWFQTFIDAARPKDGKAPRVGWLISHLFFGPLASYLYYYVFKPGGTKMRAATEDDLKRRANEGRL